MDPTYETRYASRPPAPRPSLWPLVLLLLGAGWIAWQLLGPRPRPLHDPDAAPRAVLARGDLAEHEKSTIELFRAASPSVVHITSVGLRRDIFTMDVRAIPQGTGSGFVWDAQGYVVTNAHVVRNAQAFRVTLADDSSWDATLVGADASLDVAVLRLTNVPPEKLKPVAVGASQDLQVGQTVLAIGNPFGLDQTLTTGVVSGLGREIQSDDGNVIRGVIQTDAAINPGNSGGPLLDSAGRLIGMNTAIISPSHASAGIGFAVPVETVNRVVPRLIRGNPQKAGLGVSLGPDSVLRDRGLKGALVMGVLPNSAAAKAGLQGARQDPATGRRTLGDVIEAVSGREVTSAAQLLDLLDEHDVGDEVELKVLRDGTHLDLKVRLQPVTRR
jgi:S1-C subfamily serine protease